MLDRLGSLCSECGHLAEPPAPRLGRGWIGAGEEGLVSGAREAVPGRGQSNGCSGALEKWCELTF